MTTPKTNAPKPTTPRAGCPCGAGCTCSPCECGPSCNCVKKGKDAR